MPVFENVSAIKLHKTSINQYSSPLVGLLLPSWFDCSHKEACFSGVKRVIKSQLDPLSLPTHTHTHTLYSSPFIEAHYQSSCRTNAWRAGRGASSELHRDWLEMFCELYSDWCSWLCIGILLNRGEREGKREGKVHGCVHVCLHVHATETEGGVVGMATQLLLKQATETNSSVKICVHTRSLEACSRVSAIKC